MWFRSSGYNFQPIWMRQCLVSRKNKNWGPRRFAFSNFCFNFLQKWPFHENLFCKNNFSSLFGQNFFYPIFEILGIRGIISPQTCQKRIWIGPFLKIFKNFCRGALKGAAGSKRYILVKKISFQIFTYLYPE